MSKKSGGVTGADAGRRRVVTDAIAALAPAPGVTAAICASLGVSRTTVARKRTGMSAPPVIARPRPRPPRALNDPQRQQVLDVLRAPRFADAETATLFKPLFDDAIEKHNVPPGQLTLHADRGGPMKAKATAFLLADLGVTRSHNRPHTSNDNPFSESAFKTLKYQPRFPKRFGCIEDARSFRRDFFDWYNQDHHHAGIGLMTPDQVHYGQIDAVHAARQATLDRAFRENPERFVKKPPVPPAKPTATWINPPMPKKTA